MLLLYCNSKQLHIFPLTEIVARAGRIPLSGLSFTQVNISIPGPQTGRVQHPQNGKQKREINKG